MNTTLSFIKLTPKDGEYETLLVTLLSIGAMMPLSEGTKLLIQGVSFEVKEDIKTIIDKFNS